MRPRRTLLLWVPLILLFACSPESSYRVLSFLFDGVPDYRIKEALATNDSVPADPDSLLLASGNAGKGPVYLVHSPYEERDCNSCHAEGESTFNLKPQLTSCYHCHRDFREKYSYVHGPVAAGYCSSCHAPHKSLLPKLLKKEGRMMCLYCHDLSQVLKNETHADIGDSDCTDCHDPHGGSDRYILK